MWRGLPARARAWAARTRRTWFEQVDAESKLEADGRSDSMADLLQFGALVAFANNYVLTSMQCVGPSMLPTLGLSGDVVLMWPTAGNLVRPQLGDVVICSSPTDPTSTICKRVTGLPGDIARFRRLPGMPSGCKDEVVIPRGQCWLEGDNAYDSTDSRYYGPVPLALVRGVVFLKLWPFREAGWISRTKPPPPPPPAHIVALQEQEQRRQEARLKWQQEREQAFRQQQQQQQQQEQEEQQQQQHGRAAVQPPLQSPSAAGGGGQVREMEGGRESKEMAAAAAWRQKLLRDNSPESGNW